MSEMHRKHINSPGLPGIRHASTDRTRIGLRGVAAYEPHCEKTGLRGFRPGPTQTRLYSRIRWLEA